MSGPDRWTRRVSFAPEASGRRCDRPSHAEFLRFILTTYPLYPQHAIWPSAQTESGARMLTPYLRRRNRAQTPAVFFTALISPHRLELAGHTRHLCPQALPAASRSA